MLAIKTTDVNVFEFACKQVYKLGIWWRLGVVECGCDYDSYWSNDTLQIRQESCMHVFCFLFKIKIDEAVRRGICFEFPLSAALQGRFIERNE